MISLADAIIHGDQDLVSKVASSYETLEYIDEYGYTPLVQAAIVDDIDKLNVLLGLGADPDFEDLTGRTALHWAADNGNVAIAEALLARKANPNHFTSAAEPVLALPLLREQADFVHLLTSSGGDKCFANDYINAKLVGHRFQLRGHVDIYNLSRNELVEVEYEGFYPEFTLRLIGDSLAQYLRNYAARDLRDYFPLLKKIHQCFQQAAQLARYQQYNVKRAKVEQEINQLLSGAMVFAPVSFKGHAIALLQSGDMFVRCDRGAYGRENGTVIVYRTKSKQHLTPSFYKQYLYEHNTLEQVNEELEKLAGLQRVAVLDLPAQITGNCAWANMEAAVPGLLFMQLWQENMANPVLDMPDLGRQALAIYDHWLRWDQDRALENEVRLLEESQSARQLGKVALLCAILFQHIDYHDERQLAQAGYILKAIAKPEYQYVLQQYYYHFVVKHHHPYGTNLMELLDYFGIDTKSWGI